MNYVLVRFHDNWSDEMDMEGFHVMPELDWVGFNERVISHFFNDGPSIEVGWGTNETTEYGSSTLILDAFTAQPITESEAVTLTRLFNLKHQGYGQFPMENILEGIESNVT